MAKNITKDKELEDIIDIEEALKQFIRVSKEDKLALIDASSNKQIVGCLVDQYYQSQSYRMKGANQTRAVLQNFDESTKDQFTFFGTLGNLARIQEGLNKKFMDIVTDNIPVCKWMKSIIGIGPVLSATLYSSFDVKVGRYATNFLSYAGLNDNNNPWLGTEKSKLLVKEAIEYRQEKMDDITKILESNIPDKKLYNVFIKTLKKVSKNIEGDIDFDYVRKEILDSTNIDIDKIEGLEISLFFNYMNLIANPKICDDILVNYIASKTTRNPYNIWKGAKNNRDSKKNKTKYISISDLESYLAKPPYNTDLKKTMFNVGEMFVRVSGKEKSLYGRIYKQKKLEYTMKNENGEYAEEARRRLEECNWNTETDTYKCLKEGKLSKDHIHARARRYAVKLFISHVHEAMYYAEYKEEAPKFYVIEYMGHHDYIPPEVDYRPFIDGEK